MAATTIAARLANVSQVTLRELYKLPKRLRADMRLIPQTDRPMRYGLFPAFPTRSTLNGTEHSAIGKRVVDAAIARKLQPIQLAVQGLICRVGNDAYLLGPDSLPLPKQVADDRRISPPQQ